MSKKKNTLKDLDEFLKQQAATLVTPAPLNSDVPQPPQASAAAPRSTDPVSVGSILNDLKTLTETEGASFRTQFYDLIIQTTESQKNSSAEDKMLINTVLYLKSGSNWKNVIKEYWSHR